MGALKIFKPTESEIKALKDLLQKEHSLPEKVARFIAEVATGEPLYFFKGTSEFTTQEAADILNVSRPFLIGLLNDGKIFHRKTGKHRRVDASSLMKYRDEQERESQRITRELTRIAEENF